MNNNDELEIIFEPTLKQDLLFNLFDNEITTEILYGGSAGSAKSYGLCALIILKCLQYPNIRIGLARNELTTLKKTTVVSFFEVASDWGLTDKHFKYNSTAGIISFYNGSEIVLVELTYKPSDPQYTRLGGQLFTFGCIDEVGEVTKEGVDIFKTRLGRWKNEKFNIKPICIMTCNPAKNWLYKDFYLPYKEGNLKPYKEFIQALPTDNPYLPESYLKNLEKLPTSERQRLLYGNWDYEDSPNALLSYDDIKNVFVISNSEDDNKENKTYYISADIAFTSDKLVIMVWEDYKVIDIIVNPTDKPETVISELADKYNVKRYNIAYDSDGVGKYLMNYLKTSKPIVNNSKALKDENYDNLKTQLYFKLCELIKNNKVKIGNTKYEEEISEELGAIEYKPTNNVGKIQLLPKGDVKKLIGRSPDFSDALAYRMIFEYSIGNKKTFKIGKF